MNTFNRIVIVILLLVLIPLLSMFFVIPHSVLTNTGVWMQELGEQLWQMKPLLRLPVGIILALFFDALAAFIIYLEVRRTNRFIDVQHVDGGSATVSVGSIVQQIKHQAEPLSEIIKVTPQIEKKRHGVKAGMEVLVAAGTDVPGLAAELVALIKQVVEVELGLKLASAPQVRIKVSAPTGKKPQRERKAAIPPTAPIPVAPRTLPEQVAPSPAPPELMTWPSSEGIAEDIEDAEVTE